MDSVTQHYIIDLSSNNNFIQVPAVQTDGNETRYVEIELMANNTRYTIDPETTQITIIGTKPDGTEIWNYCELTEEGYILVEITYQMATVAGRSKFQIMLLERGTNNALKSFPFYLIVTPNVYDSEEILSSNEFGVMADITEMAYEAYEGVQDMREELVTGVAEAKAAAITATGAADTASDKATIATNKASQASDSATSASNSANSASTNALKAEGFAVGKQNGVPVTSDSDYYENNAKYYKEQTDTNCEDSEAYAKGTRHGSAVPSTDPAYHNNSKYYSDLAESYKDQAAAIVGIDIATTSTPGIVKPDGDTISVENDGTIKSAGGKYSYSNETITMYMSLQT